MIKNTLLFILALWLFSLGNSKADDITVYYKVSEPHLTVRNDIPIGKSSDIIKDYGIWSKNNITFKQIGSIRDMIDLVAKTPNSLGIGAISITHNRLVDIKYSIPYTIIFLQPTQNYL